MLGKASQHRLSATIHLANGEASHNRLDTGSISFSDIANKADYRVSHVGVSVGSVGGLPTVYSESDAASSTSQSAVEQGTLIIRDEETQRQDSAELSRDTAQANDVLGQRFDREKVRERIDRDPMPT